MAKTIIAGVGGQLGSMVADKILQQVGAEELIFTSSSMESMEPYADLGVAMRQANFDIPGQLPQAFEGAERLLLISLPFLGDKRRRLQQNAIDGAKEAGIKRIIYLSFIGAGDPENPALIKEDHEYTENYIKDVGGMEYIFLRNSLYTEEMVAAFEQAANSGGIFANNMGEGKVAYVSREDCAQAAAAVAGGAGEPNMVYYITGPELLTISEFIRTGSEATGRDVRYVFISDDEMYKTFDEMGVPRSFEVDTPETSFNFCSDDRVSFCKAVREDKMSYFTYDFQKLTGRAPMSVGEVFKNMGTSTAGESV